MRETIVYVNSRDENLRYVHEAAASAVSFRRVLPTAEVVLYTDAEGYEDPAFDDVRYAEFTVPNNLRATIHKNGQMAAKLNALPSIDSDRILYLGSDTYALSERAGDLFEILDRFDIAVAHAPNRINTELGTLTGEQVPACFPEYNCDLVLWRRNSRTTALLEEWRSLYLSDELGHPHDQGAFRLAAYRSDVRIATLPPEYNYRGPDLRDDTIILQNRDLLDRYLRIQENRRGNQLPLAARAVNRGLRSVGSSLRLTLRPGA